MDGPVVTSRELERPTQAEKPGPRDPEPQPATNAEGYVSVPSDEDKVAGSLGDDPQPPADGKSSQSQPALSGHVLSIEMPGSGGAEVAPEDITVRGDDEGGWFVHHPDLGDAGPLATLQEALEEALDLGGKHSLGVSVQMVDGTEQSYWTVGTPRPAQPKP